MNEFQGGGNINDVIHIFPATGAKHHEGHGWPGAFPAGPNKIMPDVTQAVVRGIGGVRRAVLQPAQARAATPVLWRKGGWLRETGFGRHITLKSDDISSDPVPRLPT